MALDADLVTCSCGEDKEPGWTRPRGQWLSPYCDLCGVSWCGACWEDHECPTCRVCDQVLIEDFRDQLVCDLCACTERHHELVATVPELWSRWMSNTRPYPGEPLEVGECECGSTRSRQTTTAQGEAA